MVAYIDRCLGQRSWQSSKIDILEKLIYRLLHLVAAVCNSSYNLLVWGRQLLMSSTYRLHEARRLNELYQIQTILEQNNGSINDTNLTNRLKQLSIPTRLNDINQKDRIFFFSTENLISIIRSGTNDYTPDGQRLSSLLTMIPTFIRLYATKTGSIASPQLLALLCELWSFRSCRVFLSTLLCCNKGYSIFSQADNTGSKLKV